MPRFGWRWLLVISSIPALAALVFYSRVPESPRYLCLKGQTDEAYDILKRAALVNKSQLPSGILLSNQVTCSDEEFNTPEATHLLSPKENQKIVSKKGFSTIWSLFSSNLTKTTLLLWIVFFGNSFSYYGIILLTSELSSGQSQCASVTSFLVDSSEDSTYRDVFITSLAGMRLRLFFIFPFKMTFFFFIKTTDYPP